MDISGAISQQILGQQAVALSAVKQSAQQGQDLAAILSQSAQTVAASNARGTTVDFSV